MTGRGEIPGLFPLLERYKTRKERYTALQSTRFVLLWSRIEGFYKPLGHAPAAFCVAGEDFYGGAIFQRSADLRDLRGTAE